MRRRSAIGHTGTSLVEILVAMVVLVIGIFSLIRLFPLGFGSILYGENATRGNALARAELEKIRSAASNLPDGIGPIHPETNTVDTALQPQQQFLPYKPVVDLPEDPRFSGANRFRRVWGETAKIPAPTSDSPYLPIVDPGTGLREPVSLYTLQFSPVYSTRGLIVYSGTPLERVVMDGPPSDAELRALGEGRYGVDYQNAVLYFAPVNYPRRFKLDYSVTVPQGPTAFLRANSIPDACVFVPANATIFKMREPGPQPADCRFIPLAPGTQLDTDEEFVYRAFEQLPPAVPFHPANPYQYKVLNTLIGILGFNPLAASGRTGAGQGRALVAKVDYDVDDWHILREDRVVSQSGPPNVDLTLNFLKRAGDIETNQEIYAGLLRDYASFPINSDASHPGTPGVDLVVVDLDTGRTLDSRTLQGDTPNEFGFNGLNGRIDYERGRIEFNPRVRWTMPDGSMGPEELIAGRRVRLFYRTTSDFAVQVTKAFSLYRREVDPTQLGARQYVQNRGELFFPPIDANQSVIIDYSWTQLIEGQKRVRTESGELHKIEDPAAADSPETQGRLPDQSMAGAWWVRLKLFDASGNPRPDLAADEPIVIRSVRGVSVIARAMWRENDRWRRIEQTTILSR
jgi:hypothetical protein